MNGPDASISDRLDSSGAYLIEVEGEFDLALTERAEAAVDRGFETKAPIVFDLQGCHFVDSSAIRVFALAARRAQDDERGVVVVATDSQIARVFELTRLSEVVPLIGSLNEALGRVGIVSA